MRPSEALELQDEMRRFARSEVGRRWLRVLTEARDNYGGLGWGEWLWSADERAISEAEAIEGSATYLVTGPMMELAIHSLQSMPRETPLATDLPSPSGFCSIGQ